MAKILNVTLYTKCNEGIEYTYLIQYTHLYTKYLFKELGL